MPSLNQYIREYKKQLDKGDIQKAYQGILEFLMNLRVHFQKQHPELQVTSSINEGRMNMSYFAFTSDFLKKRKLKIVILFNHNTLSFETWLCGFNKKAQKEYWELIKASDWNKYRVPDSLAGNFSITEQVINASPDFDKEKALTEQLEQATLAFTREVETFLQS